VCGARGLARGEGCEPAWIASPVRPTTPAPYSPTNTKICRSRRLTTPTRGAAYVVIWTTRGTRSRDHAYSARYDDARSRI